MSNVNAAQFARTGRVAPAAEYRSLSDLRSLARPGALDMLASEDANYIAGMSAEELQHPVILRHFGNGQTLLDDGEHRVLRAAQLGLAYLPVVHEYAKGFHKP